jgi:type IV secretion system protein VirB2
MNDDERCFVATNTARSGLVPLHCQSEPCHDFSKKSAALLCMGAVLSIALVEPALAQTANIEGVLQNIVNLLTGNVARLLATLAVIIVGIAWMFGYLDLRKAAYVVLGVAITFGASEVVSTLTGGH